MRNSLGTSAIYDVETKLAQRGNFLRNSPISKLSSKFLDFSRKKSRRIFMDIDTLKFDKRERENMDIYNNRKNLCGEKFTGFPIDMHVYVVIDTRHFRFYEFCVFILWICKQYGYIITTPYISHSIIWINEICIYIYNESCRNKYPLLVYIRYNSPCFGQWNVQKYCRGYRCIENSRANISFLVFYTLSIYSREQKLFSSLLTLRT